MKIIGKVNTPKSHGIYASPEDWYIDINIEWDKQDIEHFKKVIDILFQRPLPSETGEPSPQIQKEHPT